MSPGDPPGPDGLADPADDPQQPIDLLQGADGALLDLIDHLLNQGVVVTGEVILGLADIDLVYLRITALLCAADRVLPAALLGSDRTRAQATGPFESRPAAPEKPEGPEGLGGLNRAPRATAPAAPPRPDPPAVKPPRSPGRHRDTPEQNPGRLSRVPGGAVPPAGVPPKTRGSRARPPGPTGAPRIPRRGKGTDLLADPVRPPGGGTGSGEE